MNSLIIFLLLGVGAIVVLAIAVIAFVWTSYNKLVKLRNRVDEGFAQISTQLQRRFDLIPNLVETVKGYAKHEDSVFEKVTEARAQAGAALQSNSVEGATEARHQLDKAAVSINAVAESYPDLKASANFINLQEELTSTENKVSFARQNYNENVNAYNTARQSFPTNFVAKFGNFDARDFFDVDTEEARVAPKVSF